MRGMLIVMTPMEPVRGFEPKRPPPRTWSWRLSMRRRQHMLRASSGFMSELMKLEKYGTPYFAVISHRPVILGLSQSKFRVTL